MKERALAYVRVSTVRQVNEGNSIASQTERIRAYARSKGISIRSKDIIIEEGTSASIPIWERDNGKVLLRKLNSGNYEHLIVTKLDRMFRITSDAILTIDELGDMEVGFHVIDMGGQSLDTTSPMGRYILIFVANTSELERNLIAERTREALQYLRNKGRKFTRCMYGWDVNSKGKNIPNWEEQSRIDFMCWQMRMNEVSATKVARMMNKRGWKGKLGGTWAAQSVINVVNNSYHLRRQRFRHPEWWSTKSWHRKYRKREQRDEKV